MDRGSGQRDEGADRIQVGTQCGGWEWVHRVVAGPEPGVWPGAANPDLMCDDLEPYLTPVMANRHRGASEVQI